MIHIRVRNAGGQVRRDVPPGELQDAVLDAQLVWVDLESPSTDEVESVARVFGWSDLTAEDLIKQGQRAKLEEFDSYSVLVMHDLFYDRDTRELTTPEVDFIIGAGYVVSVHNQSLAHLEDTRETEHHLRAALASGPDFLLYALADRLVDGYFPTIDAMHEEVEELEQAILAEPNPALLPQIFDMKRTGVTLRRLISPQIEAFSLLTSPGFGIVTQPQLIYFRDVHDHLIRLMESIDTYRDLMSGVMDAYLSNVSNRLNEVIKRLTVLASLFLPMTFFTGLMGMNLRREPPWDDALFWLIIVFLLSVSFSQWFYFKRKGWV